MIAINQAFTTQNNTKKITEVNNGLNRNQSNGSGYSINQPNNNNRNLNLQTQTPQHTNF